MKKVEIENRIKELKKRDFFMVDLTVGDEKIETGENPIESHSFWSDMSDQAQRAIYRIEKNNPTMSFKFDMATLGMSDEDLDNRFKAHMKEKYQDLDVDKVVELIDDEINSMVVTGPDDNHPNPFMKFPVDSQLTKNLIICIIDKFIKEKESV